MATNKTVGPNWQITETQFRPEFCRKYESIMCQGNGYMGVRAATEEDYEKTVRYTLVAGTFDKMERKNTTELPNSAETIESLLQSRLRGRTPDRDEGRKLAAMLQRRGFSWREIRPVLQEYLSGAELPED